MTQTDVTDPRGHVQRFTFNSDHYVTSDTEAYGTTLARTITMARASSSNLVTAVVDGLNRRTEYTYDTSGHVLTETRLAGTQDAVTTTFTYEPTYFQLATVTDPLNHTWTTTYDSAGRLTGVTDPLNHETTVTMNAGGQITQVTDALQHAWQLGYTGADLTSFTDPLGNVRTRFVDAAGRVTSSTDPLGRITQTVFDKLNRATSVTDPLAGQTTFSYDANSNLLSLTDALSHATSYTYDNFDRVATRTDPLLHSASYSYDFNDHLTQSTDRKGQVTSYTYDVLDRVSQVTFNDQSSITYTYDPNDRITQIADSANGTISRQYDDLDRLTQETTPEGTVSYTYDADSRRTTMTVLGQSAVTYTYNNAHRLTSIAQGSSAVSLAHDDANRRSTVTYPNGIIGTYVYDAANQVTGIGYTLGQTTLGDLTYTYDAVGNRTGVGGSWARTGLPVAVASATHDAANRIATWAGTSFSYDPNGNLTSDGSRTYAWNARDQLTAATGGTSASFAYDALGRRRVKTIGSGTTKFLYDGVTSVQEQSSGGTSTANLITGLAPDEIFTRTDANGPSTLLVDALGTVLELADGSGTLQTHYTFEAFGFTSLAGATSSNRQQFTGRENDDTGLYFYRSRYYEPRLQRFISEDPIEFKGGDVNLYAYVWNSPAVFGDPFGLAVVQAPATCSSRKHPILSWFCSPAVIVGGAGAPPMIGAGMSGGAAAAAAKAAEAARAAKSAYAKATGDYPTKPGGGGVQQKYDPATGRYTTAPPLSHSPLSQLGAGLAQGFMNGKSGAEMPTPLTPLQGWGQIVGQIVGSLF